MEIIKLWHKAVKDRNFELLDEILSEDVVFHSPVLWTPQKGITITKMYLFAAMNVIGNDEFNYTKEIISNQQVCLEFTTKIDDIVVNGVDIITLNKEGKISEFKVMVRPLKGMMILKDKMVEFMNKMKS